MTTTLPADDWTARLAERVAKIKRQPLEVVVREAIEATALEVGALPVAKKRIDMDRVRAILARIDALPVVDARSAEEIIGYDEHGLPR